MRTGWGWFVGVAGLALACRSDFEFSSTKSSANPPGPDAAAHVPPDMPDTAEPVLPPPTDVSPAQPDTSQPAPDVIAMNPEPDAWLADLTADTARPVDRTSDLPLIELLCKTGKTCGPLACGDGCVMGCNENSTCAFAGGARSVADCYEAHCDFTVSASGDVHCREDSSCTVRCLGTCQVDCSRSSDCKVTCPTGKTLDLEHSTGGC